ncbi:hypothetical protein QYE76_033122 [Lolium multiflorum]|uniref:Uncharacterized protein n=1 Tax=Lolium multiflorum TaxID=4521 RepID=A0AAD8QY49_LOLMU|nr:hypothetical protein QYE76_033122 [Lolium multiflorum]
MLETVTVTLKMDSTVLHCIFCSQPLKPPVFKCKGNHLACGRCLSELPGNRCHRCVEPRGGFEHDPAMDAVVSAATVECPHSSCGSLVAYHQVHDHKIACPHAPCACTEPGCDLPRTVASFPSERNQGLIEPVGAKKHVEG